MIILLFCLFLFNAVLAMSEMALVSIKKARLQRLIDQNDRGALTAIELADHPAEFLSAIQIGITLIAIISGIVGETVFADPIAHFLTQFGITNKTANLAGSVISVAIITYFSILIGELVPKRLGYLFPEQIARRVAIPLKWLARIAHPGVVFLSLSTRIVLRLMGIRNTHQPKMTEDELHAIFEEGNESGLLDDQERQMLKNVIRLDLRTISSVMVPRADIEWLSTVDPIDETLNTIMSVEHAYFPLCGETVDDVMGIVNAKTVLHQYLTDTERSLDLVSLSKKPLYLLESLTCLELLTHLREQNQHMALVVDEYGDIQGLVTRHDLLEVIAGEFEPANREDAEAIMRDDGSWLLDGLIAKLDLKDKLHIKELPDEENDSYHTLAGLMLMRLGKVPQTTDKIEIAGWIFEIVDMDGQRIDKVLANRIREDEE